MNNSKLIAYGAIMAALSLILTFLGGIIPACSYIAQIISGLILIVYKDNFGLKNSLIVYSTVAILMFIIAPKKSSAYIYTVLFGYYPIVYDKFNSIKSTVLRFVIKTAIFESVGCLSLFLILKIMPFVREHERFNILLPAGIVAYNIFAVVYDASLRIFFSMYGEKWKKIRLK